MAQVWSPPAASLDTADRAPEVGARREHIAASLGPSCPCWLLPQHLTRSSAEIAQVWSSPSTSFLGVNPSREHQGAPKGSKAAVVSPVPS